MTKAAYLKNRDLWIRMLVDDIDLSHATVRVGLHLAMRINADDKAAWPSTATIAKLTGVSVRSVISALQALEDAGYLLCARKRNVGNRYWLRFKWNE
ncbi:helix-turn-helix domain-containing protein [Ochrobactrum intermedium]|uniref:helix-turn-helix domain-containing protein n=1 Tax=Brucella intermedia TaxID=94625 RepID=UPI00128D5C06|nr:helix-turn-helix domain-containing protein [Brucella intermedia]MPR62733.1 helix-turn-helix domain-containing protein [Brucella intermedia]